METRKHKRNGAYSFNPDRMNTPADDAADMSGESTFTRRDALRMLLGAGIGTALLPTAAFAVDKTKVNEAQDALDDAQAKYDQVNSQLDMLGDEFEELAQQQSTTLSQIEETSRQIDDTKTKVSDTPKRIDDTQKDIVKRQAELDSKKEVLAARVAGAYKSGGRDFLSVLMSSASFEDLISNVYYLDKISESDAAMIEDVKEAKETLDRKKAGLEEDKTKLQEQQKSLEQQKSDLDALSQTQKQQLEDMRAKQNEVQKTLDGLSGEVADLMKKRDAEIMDYNAARQAEKEAARKAAANSNPGSSNAGSHISKGGGQSSASTGSQAAIVNACHSVGSPGAGYCAMWVSLVFQRAGYGYIGGDACDMYNAYCTSSSKSNLKVGMIVAVSSHPHTRAGRIYGHIGIYIGGGMMMDNIGYIRTESVDEWISFYGQTVTPRWGWAGNIVLS